MEIEKMKIDIHNYSRQVDVALNRLKKERKVNEKNKNLILSFVDYLVTEGISKPRITKYIDMIRYWAILLNKDFDLVKKEDIAKVLTKIQLNENYSVWTKHAYKVMLRRFFQWLKKTGDDYPEEVKWMKSRISKCDQKLPGEGELLSEEEVMKVLAVTDHPRDRAFISVLWESGCRVGEIGSMRISNVLIDELGILITVIGKTGSRKIRLVSSTEPLISWLKVHPFKNDKDSPLWINRMTTKSAQPLSYRNIAYMIQWYFNKAGINKRCNPHIFRHSRATFLANHLTEFQMNQYFGWVQGSDMPSTYVHMSGKEVEQAILTLNGITNTKEQSKESKLVPKKCPRCQTLNSFDSSYCSKCACVLDMKLLSEMQDQTTKEKDIDDWGNKLLNALMKNPEALKRILEDVGAKI